MSFRVTQKTLESLEWPEVARRLREECRTPRQETGNSFADFAEGLSEVKARLTETSEARALLDGDQVAPLGGVVELYAAFQHAEKGGTL
ncbi:MAG: endonuclease MutS2, partial [Myxococcota bacterium]